MDDRAAVCRLHRRAGFGLAEHDLEAAIQRGFAAELDALLSTDAQTRAVDADPWSADGPPPDARDRRAGVAAIDAWLDHMVATTTPLVDRMAWSWHGHFVSALDKVKDASAMIDQVRLFRGGGLGSFSALLRAVAVDPAMLIYLDGNDSTAASPNENFSRELLELFTVGVGGYEEADVAAGAAALTGWRVRRRDGSASLVAARHDDTAQTYLGITGVHDVDGVVEAIMAAPRLGASVASALSRELVGTTDASIVAGAAADFAAGGFDIATLVRSILSRAMAADSGPVVLAPVPWLTIAQRVTGARLKSRLRLDALRTAGQLPMLAPNVAGWPGGPAWFGSSTIVARAQLAAAVATAAPSGNPARDAADGDDLERLARALGLAEVHFGEATERALGLAAPGPQRLALALTAPEFVLA